MLLRIKGTAKAHLALQGRLAEDVLVIRYQRAAVSRFTGEYLETVKHSEARAIKG